MTLKSYMVELATNLDRLSEFIEDAHQSAKKAGLSDDDITTLFSGDQTLLYAKLTQAEGAPR